MTGSADMLQLPNYANASDPNSVGLADYINSFYNYDFPSEFRSLKLKDIYTFNTTMGVDTYAFNSEQYTTIEQPCYCAKREIALFTDPWSFYGVNFNWQNIENFSTGNGTTGPYTGYTQATPLLRSINNNPNAAGSPNVPGVSQGYSGYPSSRVQNLLITANVSNGNTLNVTDDGNGNLIGNCMPGGSVNYGTGQIQNLVFTQAVPGGNNIQIQYNPTTLAIPLSILFFQNQFTLRPIPDYGYTVELVAYRQPTQALMSLMNGTGTPELSEWWECLAVGAAKKIFEDRLDTDGIALMDKILNERYQMIYTRTYAQLSKQKINTIFAEQGNLNYGSGFGFGTGGAGGT
jgi:hypothetical protein